MHDDVPVLDRDHLARQTFDDADLAREVLALFLGQIDKLGPTILAPGPAVARADAAHTLKGSARGIGALRLAVLLQAIERDLRGGVEPGAEIAALPDTLAATQSEIAPLIA